MTRFLFSIALIMVLAACGQAGDLYLPPQDEPEPVAEPAPAREATPIGKPDEREEEESR